MGCSVLKQPPEKISIHALREEGDQSPSSAAQWTTYFYPRPPRGGRPPGWVSLQTSCRISIHALREEGDQVRPSIKLGGLNFYPRPPRGGRRWVCVSFSVAGQNFYPRPPRGGRPLPGSGCSLRAAISIHALREEGDSSHLGSCIVCPYFYPRPPRGGRQAKMILRYLGGIISIHALREEGDFQRRFVMRKLVQFLSTPSARRATAPYTHRQRPIPNFYPRPPRGGRLLT